MNQKVYHKKWLRKLRKAWKDPDRNFMLWTVVKEIIRDDSGDTDELTQELAKWVNELSN